jgi:competence protein ComGC
MKKFLVISTLVLALAATAVAAFSLTGRAYAQSPTSTVAPTTQAQATTMPGNGTSGDRYGGRHGNRMGGDQLRSYMLAAEAEAFGLTSDELQAQYDAGKTPQDLAIEQNLTVADFEAKMDAARQAALAKAVTDGIITQDQADAFAARKEAGRPAHAADTDNPLHTYMQAALADAFGLTVDELNTLETDGKTLKDLAIEQNLTVADFQTKMDTARQTALDKAVADGVITQAQADAMKNHTEMGGGRGGHGGMGGPAGKHGGPRGGQCPQTSPDNSTTAPES